MLTQKAKELGLSNTKYYVDDGYTGTNFNRPAFQELLDDIEMGYISVVIVRDLSRLGRDYVSVGHYTDNYFPEHIMIQPLNISRQALYLTSDRKMTLSNLVMLMIFIMLKMLI